MTFPDRKYGSVDEYCDDYFARLSVAAASVDRERLARAAGILQDTFQYRATMFVCGNGGSAAISNHFVCDHSKLVQTDTDLRPESMADHLGQPAGRDGL